MGIDELAQEIRRVDGSNSLGAGGLAEKLMPFIVADHAAEVERLERERGVVANLLDGHAYVFWNPDSGEEYNSNHPVESGECEDAERIRNSTATEDALWAQMQAEFTRAEAAEARNAELEKAAEKVLARRDEAKAKELTAGGTYFSIPCRELNALDEACTALRAALKPTPEPPHRNGTIDGGGCDL